MLWPQKVANFSIFRDSVYMLGVADVTMPNLANLTDAWKGSGLGGETDVPIQAHFQPFSVVLNWHVLTEEAASLAAQDGLNLDCWADYQHHNSATNKISHVGWRYFLATLPKGLDLGTLEVGVSNGAATELECVAVRILREDREILAYDKENLVCRVRGVDYAARIRQVIGRG
jgi:Bacteriophage tail tube protein